MLAALPACLTGHISEPRTARSLPSVVQVQPSESLQAAHPFFSEEMGNHSWRCETCPNSQTPPPPSPLYCLPWGAGLLQPELWQQLLHPQYDHSHLLLLFFFTTSDQQQVSKLNSINLQQTPSTVSLYQLRQQGAAAGLGGRCCQEEG